MSQKFQLIQGDEFKSSLSVEMERLSDELSRTYRKALDSWLERCIERWCPKAYALAKARLFPEAHQALADGKFYFSQETLGCDNVATFWQDETPLARCRLEINLHGGINSASPSGQSRPESR